MVALSPEEQERVVRQYVARTLTLLEETETTPEKLDRPTMRRTLIRLSGLVQALTHRTSLTSTANAQNAAPTEQYETPDV